MTTHQPEASPRIDAAPPHASAPAHANAHATEAGSSDPRLLLVGAPTELGHDLERFAAHAGERIEHVRDATAALRALTRRGVGAVIAVLDKEPDELLHWWVDVLRHSPRRPRLVVLVAEPAIGFVLRAWQMGVFDVVPLPVTRDRFVAMVHRVIASDDETPIVLPSLEGAAVGPTEIISGSPSMLPVFRTMSQVAPSTTTVLIQGNSGTGKELVARGIHLQGPRAAKPFVAINCAAIPEALLESELFGHEKGSFTGAIGRKIGRFERAHGGTLFLDEIGDMSLVLQSKILRALQEREIERVGGNEPIPVNVRLIAATHRDLKALIADGRFREDLYYRVAVVTLTLPRLADRGDDLLLLTTRFLAEFGARQGKTFTAITHQALELLGAHEWAGNVRELRNVVERAVLISDGPVLASEHLPEAWRTRVVLEPTLDRPQLMTLEAMESRQIAFTLDFTHGHVGEAAVLLGVHRNTLSRKIKEYGL